uniref:hypothetical protein n=1 Tax=Stenotrophomonas sp. SrG TaxID=3414430 RepID=UPI003CE6987F
LLPLLALAVVYLGSGRNLKVAYFALALGQGSPQWATYGILGAGTVAFFVTWARLGAEAVCARDWW